MDLSNLVFKTETSELLQATEAIGALIQEMNKATASAGQMARTQAQTEAVLARAAKNYAEARKQNAEATAKELQTANATEQAEQKREKALKKTTEAVDENTSATSKHTSVLQRQSDILEFQAQGWSKSQAGILATARAAKTAAEDMQKLMEVLDTQRKLMGTDPFDKSMSGLKSLQNQYREATEAMKQYESESGLTSKQTRELARDKERLITQLQQEKKSVEEIDKAIKKHNEEYVALANKYNDVIRAEEAVIKKRKEMVSAANYVTQADEKMKAALDATNSSLNKAATDELVKYETALHKSGLAQDLITKKLETYKGQLAQVQAAEQKRAADHLARSLSPQLTDIGVSLWSGQSPLTVLIQQGGQMMDLFRMSGVAAQDFGKVMRESFNSMLPAMATVAKGLASFVVGSLYDAGKAATSFIANITGISAAMDMVKRNIAAGGEENFKYIASLQKLSAILSGIAGAGFAVMLTGLVGLAIGLKQVISEENNLAKALSLSGGSLAVSQVTAIQYAKSMNDVGVSTGDAISAITAMAKAGNFAASEIPMVTKAAADMEKYAGVAIEDTVKAFSKLKEKPVESILELAKTTGMLAPEVVKAVVELDKQGKTAEATAMAMQALGSVNTQQIDKMKQEYNGFSLFIIDLGKNISNFFSGVFKNLFYKDNIAESLDAQLKEVRTRIAETKSNLETSGKVLGVFGIKTDDSVLKKLQEQERMIISQIGSVVRLAGEEERRTKLNTDNAKAISLTIDLEKKYASTIEKSKQEINKLEQQRTAWQKEGMLTKERDLLITKGIASENEKIQKELNKGKSKKGENYYAALMREATNATIEAENATKNLTKAEETLLKIKADPRFATLSKQQKADVEAKYAGAIAAEKQERATIALGKAEEFRDKVLGKSEGLGKQYYADIEALREHAKVTDWSTEQIDEMIRKIYEATPAWNKYSKDIEEAQKALNKYNEESISSKADTSKENLNLDLRLSLLGKTVEEQRKLQIEHERSIKLSEVDLDLAKKKREIEASIAKAKKDNLPDDSKEVKGFADAIVQAEQDAAEKRKLINREVAVQYAEDMQKEFDRISGGITDSIVTALFEGGKAGSQSIRNFLVNELKKPVTLVVQAVVNTLLGSVIGGIAGGAASGGASSLMSAGASGIGSSLAGNVLGSLGAFGGAVQGFGTAALAATQSMIGMTGTVAQMSTSLAAAGHTAAAGMQSGIAAFQAIPGWGWALAGIGLLAGLMDFGGETRFGGGYQLNGEGKVKYTAGPGGGQIANREQEQVATQTYKSINSILESFGSTLKVIDFYAGLETSSKGKGGTFAGGKLTGGIEFGKAWKAGMYNQDLTAEEAVKQYIGQMKIVTVEALKAATDIPLYVQDTLKDVDVAKLTGETADAVLQEVNAMFTTFSTVKAAFELLNKPMFDTSTAGYELTESFVALFGGLENFKSAASSFYDTYYTAAEKEANLRTQLTKTLVEQNLAIPETQEAYRKLVEAQDLTTEAGRKNYAVLLNNAGVFAELTPVVDVANKQISGMNKIFSALGVTAKVSETKFSSSVKDMFESLGLVVEEYSNSIASVIEGVVTGKIKAEDAGKELADAAVGGITNAIAQGASQAIAAQFVSTIISPIIANIMAGNAALAGIDMQAGLTNLRSGTEALKIVLNTVGPELQNAFSGLAGAVVGGANTAVRMIQNASLFTGVQTPTWVATGNTGGNTSAGFDYNTSYFAGVQDSGKGQLEASAVGAISSLVAETLESNKRVSELLKEFLNPAKDYENRYLELADKLVAKKTESMFDEYNSTITSLEGKIARDKKVLDIATTLSSFTGLTGAPVLDESIMSGIFKDVQNLVNEGFLPISTDVSAFVQNIIDTANGLSQTGNTNKLKSYIDMFLGLGTGRLNEGIDFLRDELSGTVSNLDLLEKELREWYLAQARVIAVEDMSNLSKETVDAKSKIEQLKRTGGADDPITSLKETFSEKLKDINEGINSVLQDEINAKKSNLEKFDPSFAQDYEDWINGKLNPEEYNQFKEAGKAYSDALGYDVFGAAPLSTIKGRIEELKKVLPGLEGEIKTLTDEQQKYITTLEDWYKTQADLLSTEMLIDINNQIKALQAEEKGPLTTIKDAIQKYIDDFTELGTLTDEIQAQIDTLSGLQLDKARTELYNQLLSEDELKAFQTSKLTEQFKELGKSLPNSAAELRKMIDAARAAGDVTLADSLLELIPAFIALQGAADGLGGTLMDTLDKTFSVLQDVAQKKIAELEKTFEETDKAFTLLERSAEAQKKVIQGQVTAAEVVKNKLSQVFDLLKDSVWELMGEVRQADGSIQYRQARGIISGAVATGIIPENEILSKAVASAKAGVAEGLYASKQERDKAYLDLANELQTLQDIAGPQLTEAELTLTELKTQTEKIDEQVRKAKEMIDVMRGVDTRILSVDAAIQLLEEAIAKETTAREQIDTIKAQLDIAQKQYDELKGINEGVKTLEEAFVAFQAAVLALAGSKDNKVPELSDDSNYGKYNVDSAVKDAYKSVLGREADTEGLAWWVSQVNSGNVKLSDIESALEAGRAGIDVKAFASGGLYPGGLALVGEQGPELINFSNPGMVYTAAQSANLMNSDKSSFIEAVVALTAEVQMLRAETRAVVSNTSKTARILDDVTEDGTSLRTNIVTE